jgi:hypothetical protein
MEKGTVILTSCNHADKLNAWFRNEPEEYLFVYNISVAQRRLNGK